MFKALLLALLISCQALAATPLASLRATVVYLQHGTGFLVKDPNTGSLLVMTNWHVCAGTDLPVKVTLPNGQEYASDAVFVDPDDDMCAIPAPDYPDYLTLAPHPKPVGMIYTRGYPQAPLTGERAVREARGTIRGYHIEGIDFTDAISRAGCPWPQPVGLCVHTQGFYETTMRGGRGASGSPVVNGRGQLVGIVQTVDDKGRIGMLWHSSIKRFFKLYDKHTKRSDNGSYDKTSCSFSRDRGQHATDCGAAGVE